MPVSLDPSAPNQSDGLVQRVANTKRRIQFFGENPTHQQIDGFAQVLSMEIREAYRKALQREGDKFGIVDRSPIDPFVGASLDHYAQQRATTVVSTYIRKQADARAQGKDLKEWRDNYANWKAPQVMQYEYARADAMGMADFYSQHPNLTGQGRILPEHVAVPDRCQVLVDRGWMPIDEAIPLIPEFPIHLNCPHYVYIQPGD